MKKIKVYSIRGPQRGGDVGLGFEVWEAGDGEKAIPGRKNSIGKQV